MDLKKEIVSEQAVVFDVLKEPENELISLDDCKKFLGKYNLPDEQIILIRNSIIAISDSVINNYIDEFNENP